MAQAEFSRSGGTPHTVATRFFHGFLALCIIVQLITSQIMQPPEHGHAGDAVFSLHEYSGLAAFALAFLFWVNIVVRRQGTPLAALVPWFSKKRRAELWQDTAKHLRSAVRFRLPEHVDAAPFPAAIHGLGLLLISLMAITGTSYFVLSQGARPDRSLIEGILTIHSAFANLVWAYIIGHALLGILHHVNRSQPLTAMWSLRG